MERVKTFGFRDNFIERLSDLIVREIAPGTRDFSRVCVVFGGRRPALFLRKELAGRVGADFFPPQCFSMDEFVNTALSGRAPYRTADPLHSCFLLYRLAREKLPELLKNRESFSRFLAWSREILNFIEQLDLQDIPEGPLKEIEISASIGYEVPESVNSLLKNINLLREDFHRALSGAGAMTRGMAYRAAAAAVPEEPFPQFDTIIFCNFYFLHTTEQRILKNLHDRGKAVLVFQRDQRDWSVLERMEKELGVTISPCAAAAATPEPEIKAYAAFDIHSQVCCAREILKQVPPDERTMILLPDPDALVPLLSEITACADNLNVSLGYPAKRSALYSLFSLIFRAQESRKETGYYARDYLRALGHPLVKNLGLLPGTDPAVSRILCHKVEELLTGAEGSELAGKLFIRPEEVEACGALYRLCGQTLAHMGLTAEEKDLRAIIAALHELLFHGWERVNDFAGFSDSAERLLTSVVDRSPVESYPLNLLICEKIFEMTALMRAGDFDTERFGRQEIFRIFLNDLENRALSFTGSPLKGLQVLGLFETRCLNFENVIVLDLNEKNLPNLSIYEPLIPREIMLGLGLNRIEKEDEIQRYQFFRLIDGAHACHLIYNASDEKEKSRFLEEILWERQKKTAVLETDIPRTAFTVTMQPPKRDAAKTAAMAAFLKKKLYSASSLNTYLHCPMRFYFQYVLGMEERMDLLDETEARDIGTFVHELLEEAFTPFAGKKPEITPAFRARFLELFETRFAAEFEKKMRSDAFLLKEILSLRLRNFLDYEARRDLAGIICLEKEYRDTIPLDIGTFDFTCRIDRIDRLEDGSALVLDYKTGGADIKPVSFLKMAGKQMDRAGMKKSLKSFQMPMYLYFTEKRLPGGAINAGLYNLRTASIGLLLKPGAEEERDACREVFLACVQALLAEIIDPATPFRADGSNRMYCDICPFAHACR